jgi:hypothetical protein
MTVADLRLAVGVAALTVWDAWTTTVALGVADGVELNPLIAALVDLVGLIPAMAVRAAAGVALVVLLARLARHPRSRLGTVPLWAAAVLLGAVAVWNTFQLVAYGPWGVVA